MSRANGTSPAKADDAPGQAWVSVRPTWRLSTLTPLFNAQEYRFQPINLPGEPTWNLTYAQKSALWGIVC
jgi:hypothetical protein